MQATPSGSGDTAHSFSVSFPATETAVHGAVGHVCHELAQARLSHDQLSSIRIVLTEAINNIVEHAYANAGSGMIELSVRRFTDRIEFRLSDTGHPLPGNRLPEPCPSGLTGPAASLPEGGFGWVLIRELTSAVEYQRDGDQNLLTLSFDLASAD